MHSGDYLSPELTLLDVVNKYKWNESAPIKFMYTFTAVPTVRQVQSKSSVIATSSAEATHPVKSRSVSCERKDIPQNSTTKTVPSIKLKIQHPKESKDHLSKSGKRKTDDNITAFIVNNSSNDSVNDDVPPAKKVKHEKKTCSVLHTNEAQNECEINLNSVKKENLSSKQSIEKSLENFKAIQANNIKKEKVEECRKVNESSFDDMDFDNMETSSLNSSRDDGELLIDESRQSDDEFSAENPSTDSYSDQPNIVSANNFEKSKEADNNIPDKKLCNPSLIPANKSKIACDQPNDKLVDKVHIDKRSSENMVSTESTEKKIGKAAVFFEFQ